MKNHKTLLQKFVEFNQEHHLASSRKKTLLAVSGGIDSVVMCHLFYEAKFPFSMAHCNFMLRGNESNDDEQLVNNLGKQYAAEVFTNRFDTTLYATEKGLSIQLAARELRYNWFAELLATHPTLFATATAHHLNDNIETILLNLTRGTGIKGLRGIPVRQANIIRPLLFATRHEIHDYCNKHQLVYREDSSNNDDKYTRNKIRHHVIPLLKEINPALEETLAAKISLFADLENMYERTVKKESAQLFVKRGHDVYIPILKLRKTSRAATLLFEYLKDHGFNAAQIQDMLQSMDAEPGKQFISATARVIKDRRFFILTELKHQHLSSSFAYATDTLVEIDERELNFKYEERDSKMAISKDKNHAVLDKAKLEFPLIIRPWKQGDYFYPFGMNKKKKKLKKFFADEKLPLHEKEKVWVVESNQKIVWVIGYRIDERFKITPDTKEILKIILKD